MSARRAAPAAATAPARLSVEADTAAAVVDPATWTRHETSDPLALAEGCAGLRSGVKVSLDGDGVPPTVRARRDAGLAVAIGQVPDIPGLCVLDVVLLGLREPQPSLLQTVFSGTRVRHLHEDHRAAARALAGRTGLAQWVDRPVADLPPEVRALADLTRALAGAPRAAVWCRPQWLREPEQERIAAALASEQEVRGFPVLELVKTAGVPSAEPSSLPEP